MAEDGQEFGDRLAGWRQLAGLSQQELAERSGLSARTVGNLERGRVHWPHPDTVRRLADALGLHGQARDEFVVGAGRLLGGGASGSIGTAAPDRDPPASGRLSSLEPGSGVPVPRQLPPGVRVFTGRKAELDFLACLTDAPGPDSGSTVVISAIGGSPGVGKTALALHWAHRVAGLFPDGQLYVNLRGFNPTGAPVDPAEAIRGFLNALGVAPEGIPAERDAQAGLYRSLLAGRAMLIVLDNARDEAQVRPLLPASPASVVLITSRSQLAGLAAADGARLLTLDLLTHHEAVQLLAARIGDDRAGAEPAAVDEIARLCAHLPLALAVTAARAAARPRFPLMELAAELRDAAGRLGALDAGEAAASVTAAFSWSCRQLSPAAARMFRLLGLHPGPDISIPAAASLAASGQPEARRLLRELARDCLITEHAPGRYAFHDLLRAYAAEEALARENAADRQQAMHRLLDHFLTSAHRAALLLIPHRVPLRLPAAIPGVTVEDIADRDEALTWYGREHAVLMGAITAADSYRFEVHAWQLYSYLKDWLLVRASPHHLRSAALVALSAAVRVNDRFGQAEAWHGLGCADTNMGHYDQAHRHYAAALRIYEALGDHLSQACVHLDLGLSYEFWERHHDVFGTTPARPRRERDAHKQSALTHARHALELFQAAGHRAGEAGASGAVGRSLALYGSAEKAVGYCERAVQMNHDLGISSAEAVALISLGYALHKAFRYADAATACQRAVALSRRNRSPRLEAIALTHLAESQRSAGNIPAARAAWEQALVLLDDLQLPDADQVRARLAEHDPGVLPANAGDSDTSWCR